MQNLLVLAKLTKPISKAICLNGDDLILASRDIGKVSRVASGVFLQFTLYEARLFLPPYDCFPSPFQGPHSSLRSRSMGVTCLAASSLSQRTHYYYAINTIFIQKSHPFTQLVHFIGCQFFFFSFAESC